MESEAIDGIELNSNNGDNEETGELVGVYSKKFRLEVKLINETDEYTDQLFKMLIDGKEDEFIGFIKNLEKQNNYLNLNCNNGHTTYLQYACRHGLNKVAEYLIQSGADLCAVCNTSYPPIIFEAVILKNYTVFCHILEKDYRQLFMYNQSDNIFHLFAETKMEKTDDTLRFLKFIFNVMNHPFVSSGTEAASYLLNEKNGYNETPLDIAIEIGNDEIIIILLENGVDMFSKDEHGKCGFLGMVPNILEEYFNRKVVNDFVKESNKMVFDYSCIVPSGCLDSAGEETSRIMYLSQLPDYRHLIKHPVVSTFTHLKWQKVKWLFYFNLLVYVIFCCLFTSHVLVNKVCQAGYSKILVSICLFILGGRELLQVYMSPLGYVRQLDNWIEIPLMVSTALTMFGPTSVHRQISAVAIFLTWTELFFLLGRYPNLSTKIVMYKRVSLNFLKYFFCYSVFIIAFALSFYILSRDSTLEDTPVTQIVYNATITIYDTLVRFSELNPDSLPIDEHPVIGRMFLIMFLLLIVIIMLNLLNGLAVSDTQAMLDEAELLSLISRLKFISSVEKMAHAVSGFQFSVAQFFATWVMRRIKVFGVNTDKEKTLFLFVSGDDMLPDVLKTARQIRRKCRRGKSEYMLNNIKKLLKENMLQIDDQGNTLKALLKRIDTIEHHLTISDISRK